MKLTNTTKTITGAVIDWDQVLFFHEVQAIKEIRPTPSGRVRLRLRNGEFPVAYVRTEKTISAHNIADMGTHWELLPAHEANVIMKEAA